MRKLLLALFGLSPLLALGQSDSVAGHTLYFDGSSSYVDTRFNTHLPVFTVSCWTKSPNAPAFLQGKGPVHYEKNFQFNWDHVSPGAQGAVVIQDSAGSWHAASFGPLEANRWYHLAATYDADTLRAYVNGHLITKNGAPRGPAKQETSTLKLGRHALLDNPMYHFFNGNVDEVRVFDRVLTPNEIRLSMHHSILPTTPGLVAYFQLNEFPGELPLDSTINIANGRRAALISAPPRLVSTTPFGPGVSAIAPAADNMQVDYPGTGVQLRYSGIARPFPAMVTRLNVRPAGQQPDTNAGRTIKVPNYIIQHFDTAAYDSVYTLVTVAGSEYARVGATRVPELKVASRPLGSDSSWFITDSARARIYLPTNVVINAFRRLPRGQFILGNVKGSLIPVSNRPLIARGQQLSAWFDRGQLVVNSTGGQLVLRDVLGRQLGTGTLSQGQSVVDLPAMPAGIYLLQVQQGRGTQTLRIYKE